MASNPLIALMPTPGIGHLIPFIALTRKLLSHGVDATILIPNDGSNLETSISILQTHSHPSASWQFLPPASLQDVPGTTTIDIRLKLILTRSLPLLRESLFKLSNEHSLVAVILDLFAVDALEVVREMGLPPYIFYASSALSLTFLFHFPKLHCSVSGEFKDMKDPWQLPGCPPIYGRDFEDSFQVRDNPDYEFALQICRSYSNASGFLVNSFIGLESGAFDALMNKEAGIPPVYPVGPLVQMGSERDGTSEYIIKWLDQRTTGSVVYVCFGSGGTLSRRQLTELALGLEASRQLFLLVLRKPSEKSTYASYFGDEHPEKAIHDYLPAGFVERTKEQGLIVHSWAPQMKILQHPAIGGFVSHCGWNSILESVVNGVPVVAWPLFAEQRVNAVALADGRKVATRVKANEDGLVVREEVEKVVRMMMECEEGKNQRKRMMELKEEASTAISSVGSSETALDRVVNLWKGRNVTLGVMQ